MDILHHNIHFTFLEVAVTGDNDDAIELVTTRITHESARVQPCQLA